MKKLLLFTFICFISCCDFGEQSLNYAVENNSNHDIVVYFGGNTQTPEEGSVYPDTTFRKENKGVYYTVPPSKVQYFSTLIKSEEEFFSSFPKDTMSIYIFHPDTLAKYKWDEIKAWL